MRASKLSRQEKKLLYDAHKIPLMIACERSDSRKRTGRPIPVVTLAKFTRDHGDRFLSRQLPARRCISGSQLTIIASYCGVAAKSVPVDVINSLGFFNASRLTRTQTRLQLCSTCANKVTSCSYRRSSGPHTYCDRFRLTVSRATNFK